ncbi:MAG: AAA family ATPase, partial [Pseudomonadales bacterium]
RDAAGQVAENCGAPFLILECHAPDEVIASWLEQRNAAGNDPSDATMDVVKAQHASREALSEQELLHSKRVDTHESASLDTLIARIRQRLPGV